jgi:hypothetical protein
MVAEESDGKAEFYSTLARFLSGDDMPDYNGLIALKKIGTLPYFYD